MTIRNLESFRKSFIDLSVLKLPSELGLGDRDGHFYNNYQGHRLQIEVKSSGKWCGTGQAITLAHEVECGATSLIFVQGTVENPTLVLFFPSWSQEVHQWADPTTDSINEAIEMFAEFARNNKIKRGSYGRKLFEIFSGRVEEYKVCND